MINIELLCGIVTKIYSIRMLINNHDIEWRFSNEKERIFICQVS